MAHKLLLGPDIIVNASVALGSPPDQVVKRVFAKPDPKAKTTDWVISRISGMLSSIPSFKPESLEPQMKLIAGLFDVTDLEEEFGPDAWVDALVASAKAVDVTRVITDHPDLADKDEVDGIEFMSSDAWLIEQTTPPPPPPTPPALKNRD